MSKAPAIVSAVPSFGERIYPPSLALLRKEITQIMKSGYLNGLVDVRAVGLLFDECDRLQRRVCVLEEEKKCLNTN